MIKYSLIVKKLFYLFILFYFIFIKKKKGSNDKNCVGKCPQCTSGEVKTYNLIFFYILHFFKKREMQFLFVLIPVLTILHFVK